MTLYEFWNSTLYYQKMFIYETNAYDQNMPLWKGSRQEWYEDIQNDDNLYWHLMDEVDHWEVTPKGNVLVKIKNDTYEQRMEEHYLFSDKWGKEKEKRPWRHSIELETYTEDGLEL